jgi:hypothetical protein
LSVHLAYGNHHEYHSSFFSTGFFHMWTTSVEWSVALAPWIERVALYCHDVFQSWWWRVPSAVIITVVDTVVPVVHHLKD